MTASPAFNLQAGNLVLTFSEPGGLGTMRRGLFRFAKGIVDFGKRFVCVGDFVVAFRSEEHTSELQSQR